MRSHFNQTFNKDNSFVTQRVIVTAEDLKSLGAKLKDDEQVAIYFAAYQDPDLQRYKLKSPEYYNMVKDKPTLIFQTKSESSNNEVVYDFGTICPPPTKCTN